MDIQIPRGPDLRDTFASLPPPSVARQSDTRLQVGPPRPVIARRTSTDHYSEQWLEVGGNQCEGA